MGEDEELSDYESESAPAAPVAHGIVDSTAYTSATKRIVLLQRNGTSDNPSLVLKSFRGPRGEQVLLAFSSATVESEAPEAFEVRRHGRAVSSWFIGNTVVKDGSLYVLNITDLMYPLISIVADTEAKMAGSYRAAYDLVSDAPALVSFAKANLELICDVVKLGSGEDEDILFRLNVQKLIAFLRVKFRHLLECPVLHKWYQQDSPAGTVFTDEQRSLQVLHLLQQYVPLWVFNKFCASLGRRTTEVDEHVAASSQQLQKSLVARDVDLKRKREEVDEARKKLALSTASNSVKKMAREGKPKNVQSIMSFFGKKA